MTKEESRAKETEYIQKYKNLGQCKCNITVDGKPGAGYGELNPNYKNGDALRRRYRIDPTLRDRTASRDLDNGRARPISLLDSCGNVVRSFECIKFMAQWLIDEGISKAKILTIQGAVPVYIKKNKPYLGFYFRYDN